MNVDRGANEGAEKTALLLATLWRRNQPVIESRLAELDGAAQAAESGRLGEELRESAADTAHRLAGSLGMYGFPKGTMLARQLELMLDYPTPDPVRLRELADELRMVLFPS